MPAHKVRATARNQSGQEIVVYPETIAPQVICLVPNDSVDTDGGEDGEPAVQEVSLDVVLNEYADEINANKQTIVEHSGYLDLLVRPGYAVCSTAGDIAEKTVALSPYILIAKKFTRQKLMEIFDLFEAMLQLHGISMRNIPTTFQVAVSDHCLKS